MISQTLKEHYRKELRQYMNDLADVVATGGATDWENYKHITGQIAGIAYAERIFLDMVELAEKED